MILVHLDGAGPLGDPYQIDSANHGPYGAAVTRELIPYVEEHFRGIGGATPDSWTADRPAAGWRWHSRSSTRIISTEPGRSAPTASISARFSLSTSIDDDNAYINQHGFERPGARDVVGRRSLHHAA